MSSEVYLMDCMEGMKQYPDKFFDLAVVDPPYGIGDFAQSDRKHSGKIKWNDSAPTKEYFSELYRISSNQIIWGSNYYSRFLSSGGAIVWDKLNFHPSMSRAEIAYCSLQNRVTFFEYEWHGFHIKRIDPNTFHPCAKPIALYSWIYKNYLPNGGKVLDTHLGSGSNRIAADKAGNIDFTGYEIDKDYYEAQEKRWNDYKKQLIIF